MFMTNLHSPLVDLLEIHRPDPRVQSKSKSTSSSGGQPRAAIAPRRARLMHALRSERGLRMTKTLTSPSGQVNRDFESREVAMVKYLAEVRQMTDQFRKCIITKVPRAKNSQAEALARLVSSCATDTPPGGIARIPRPSINLGVLSIDEEEGS
ncbi:hypothetical protein B296_00035638 [Ensete ventricosum]|uniref:RNase H type-1 domain-containing protein n=1 Tax=Ensete ventricosum TaxID=4639 RepID=A0A426YCU7_ENSVE|nr:hypothetical protein B296_00035638 [Ensete ventricosum]